jgi:ABC-type antimicrobial peptide transport system permease subunit
MEIVGVVDDVWDQGAGVEPGPSLYVNYFQQNTATARPTLIVKGTVNPASLFPSIRRAIWSVDRNQTIDSMNRLDDLLLRSAAQPRFAALMSALLAISALILVLSGIYAVTLYTVLRRTRELGVLAALGARPIDLVRATMWQSMRPVAVGVVVGLLIAVPAVHQMRHVLTNGVGVEDVPILSLVVLGLLGATAVAAALPSRRALAIPPSIAMRA